MDRRVGTWMPPKCLRKCYPSATALQTAFMRARPLGAHGRTWPRRWRCVSPYDGQANRCALAGRLVAQERSDLRVRRKLRQILRRGQLRLVARGVHHAEEAERLAPGGAELMPGHRRHGHEIAGLDRSDLAADEAMAAPAQDQHRVHVPVPFQAGETAGRHLEIAQLPMQLWI